MKHIWATSQTILLLSAFSVVARGPHARRRNSTDYLVNRYCTLLDHSVNTQCVQTEYQLLCTGGLTKEWMREVKHDIYHLRVMDCPGPCVNIGRIQEQFPELRVLELINCTKLNSFKGHFGPTSKIEKITIHGSKSLWEIPGEVVKQMPELQVLDLRWNGIRHMKNDLLSGPPALQRVHLSGNEWDCSDGGLDWLAMQDEHSTARRRIVDYEQLMCQQTLHKGKPLHRVMDIIKTTHDTCPEPCACTMTHVVSDTTGAIIPLITVNCAGKNLEGPPSSLPPDASVLNLAGNKINTIRSIIQSPQYRKLVDLHLDNNSISAVKELEGSEWFTKFRVLSLRGNLLKQIPVYAFDKAFQVNNNIVEVYLGHNPWRCDCHFIPRFQGLLLKYKRVIKDLPDIRCSKSDDKTTSLVQISTIPLGNVCNSDMEMPISTINIINLVLLSLIMFVLGRFLYDWRNFKATGKLPWLSSILP